MFQYTLDNKRYHTLNYFFKKKFGQKVMKVPLDVNAPCPHKQNGGCIFCSNRSKANIIIDTQNIIEQFNNTKSILEKKWPNSLYIPYFQSGTNTYLDVETLKDLIEKLLRLPKVVGIAIATRPDTINEEWYKYLNELNKKTFLMIELGLQSSKESTLQLINRGHGTTEFTNAIKRLQQNKIFTVAHIINGLPHESKEDMLNTIKYLNHLGINGLKIHMLFICKNTKLAHLYKNNPFPILSKEEYIDIVCEQLGLLKDSIVIERITGDPDQEELIAPTWVIKKFCVLNDIDKMMKEKNYYQGCKEKSII